MKAFVAGAPVTGETMRVKLSIVSENLIRGEEALYSSRIYDDGQTYRESTYSRIWLQIFGRLSDLESPDRPT